MHGTSPVRDVICYPYFDKFCLCRHDESVSGGWYFVKLVGVLLRDMSVCFLSFSDFVDSSRYSLDSCILGTFSLLYRTTVFRIEKELL